MSILSDLEQAKDKAYLAIGCIFLFAVTGFLVIFLFNRSLFLTLDILKLLALSITFTYFMTLPLMFTALLVIAGLEDRKKASKEPYLSSGNQLALALFAALFGEASITGTLAFISSHIHFSFQKFLSWDIGINALLIVSIVLMHIRALYRYANKNNAT